MSTLPGDEREDHRALFRLDPAVVHLNHGSFGACPTEILEAQSELRARLERNAMQFFLRDLEGLLDGVRESLGAFLGAKPEDLAFVNNATTAVNAVLRSLPFAPGDELLTTDHAYAACKNAIDFVAERTGARVVVADVPIPLAGPDEAVEAVVSRATARTKLAMVDHVTSQTATVMPIDRIVAALDARGIDTLVDGAHAPGMVPLHLDETRAAYTTGNCHKWLCAPKGSAYLHVRADRQGLVRPLTISHGARIDRADRSRFALEFDWPGTWDPTPVLVIPACLALLERAWPGGLVGLRERNRALALRARAALLARVGGEALVPESMIGSIASVELSEDLPGFGDPHLEVHRVAPHIEVPVFRWRSRRLLRVSAQLYNRWPDYEALLRELPERRA
ncbi:MAG: aminotransferase class V-fold PLP-dependent enzyme [Polyangiaceae bacterium]